MVWLLAGSLCAQAQSYTPLDSATTIRFYVNNFGLKVSGTVAGIKGSIQFDEKNLANASLNLTAQVATVSTGIALRDDHLKGRGYFDLKQFPQMRFTSSSVTRDPATGNYVAAGQLSIKGTTRDIRLPFSVLRTGEVLQFNCTFEIDRTSFGVGGGSLSLSDNVKIEAHIRTIRASN